MAKRTTTDRVVCALDDSPQAAGVLDTAAALAGRLDRWLTIVHSPTPDIFTVGERRRDVIRRGRDYVASVARGHEVNEVIVQPGEPAHVIMECLRGGAGLAVVGSRGLGVKRAALLGSVSGDLARNAPCAVVIVPPGASMTTLGTQPGIVCGLDGSAEAAHALEWATRMAWTTGGRLLPVHVRRAPTAEDAAVLSELEREVSQPAPAEVNEAGLYVKHGDAAEQLDELARAQSADLIVVGSHSQTALRAALSGSVSVRLAAEASRPVVVVPRESRLDALWAPLGMHVAA